MVNWCKKLIVMDSYGLYPTRWRCPKWATPLRVRPYHRDGSAYHDGNEKRRMTMAMMRKKDLYIIEKIIDCCIIQYHIILILYIKTRSRIYILSQKIKRFHEPESCGHLNLWMISLKKTIIPGFGCDWRSWWNLPQIDGWWWLNPTKSY